MTCEGGEQGSASFRGVAGGKGLNQGESGLPKHVPNPVSGKRATGGGPDTESFCRQLPEVGAGWFNDHVRICAGGAQQCAFLPQPRGVRSNPHSYRNVRASGETQSPGATRPHLCSHHQQVPPPRSPPSGSRRSKRSSRNAWRAARRGPKRICAQGGRAANRYRRRGSGRRRRKWNRRVRRRPSIAGSRCSSVDEPSSNTRLRKSCRAVPGRRKPAPRTRSRCATDK